MNTKLNCEMTYKERYWHNFRTYHESDMWGRFVDWLSKLKQRKILAEKNKSKGGNFNK